MSDLQQLIQIRSRQTLVVLDFLDRLPRFGLTQFVTFRPEAIKGWDILDFCLDVRVISHEQYYKRNSTSDSSPRPEDHGYSLPTQELLMRDGRGYPKPSRLENVLRSRHRALVLRGEPGEGKSTALWLHIGHVCRNLRTKLEQFDIAPNDPDFRVPLVLPLNILKETPREALPQVALEYTLGIAYGYDLRPPALVNWLQGRIECHQYELCLDALDELPSTRAKSRRARKPLRTQHDWLRDEVARLGDVPVLLTTRLTADDRDLFTAAPDRHYLVGFNPREVRQYIERRFAKVPNGQVLADDLRLRLRQSPGPRHLVQLPLLLAILCDYRESRPDSPLPDTRTKLLSLAVRQLLEKSDSRKRGISPNPHEARTSRNEVKEKILYRVAEAFTDDGPRPMSRQELLAVLREELRRFEDKKQRVSRAHRPQTAEALLEEYLQDGILVAAGVDSYRFTLRSLHEYFLAGSIAALTPEEARQQYGDRVNKQPKACPQSSATGVPDSLAQKAVREFDRWDSGLHTGWYHVWPLVCGHRPKHVPWLIDVVWRNSRDGYRNGPRNVLAAELIHESGQLDSTHAHELRGFLNAALGQRAWGPESLLLVVEDYAKAMAALSDPASRDLMIARLNDELESSDVHWQCKVVLGIIGDEESRKVLVAHQSDENLRRIGDGPSRDFLIARLDDSQVSDWSRVRIAEYLGDIGDDVSRDALITWLNDSQAPEQLRRECAKSVGRIGGDESRDALITWLNDPQAPDLIRYVCADSLHHIGGDESREALIACLYDPQAPDDVRCACAESLRVIGGERSREALITRLYDPDTSESVRESCTWRLAVLGDRESRRALISQLNDSRAPELVRCGCAKGLGYIGDEESREAMITLLHDSQAPERLRCECARWLRNDNERSRIALVACRDAPKTSDELRRMCERVLRSS